ncbi:hypothetical protein VP01_85g11 [Puccinia sorghi]|uniref:BRCT domain-containing protein n=1 Tax=Puccinia sorghi TaxID=27349 RepID=A0A0L6U915_9BASI|nr:hypothetical protein VP01_85g11 [Puccinia sorghi]
MEQIIPPSQTDIFRDITFFIDPSLPTILALQLKALLTHNHAKSAPESTDDFNHENFQPEGTSHQASSSPQPNPNFKPRFDLTQTTHIITNSLHLPEYIVLGKWDDQAGNILTFSYQPQPNQSNHHNRASPSNDQNKSRLHRSIHLITPIWVTQSYDLNKLLPTVSYSPDPYMFFSGIVIALDSAAKLPLADVELIQACTQAWGGQFRRGLTKEVTHLICCDEETRDYQIASKLKRELGIKIVLPHWFHHSVFFRHIISEKPFEFPSPAILTPRSPSILPDYQHGIDGLPGNKLPPSRSPVEEDPELESSSHQKATELAFTCQKLPTRSPLLKDSPAYREFQDKSVYLVSSLGLSLSARRTLSRRIVELGAKVFDGGDLQLSKLEDLARSDVKLLKDAADAEQHLRNSDIVICEYRTGWEFWLAWEQGKRIGTLHWILCILNNINSPTCTVRPPIERLLDFPSPPEPISGCEPDSKPITVTNYTGSARTYLIKLIERMHMKFRGPLLQDTSLLVAANKAGSKVAYASKNGIQLVNHQYLEDCFQSWTKQSIQAHHLTFPDGVNISELIGTTTQTTDGILDWSQRAQVMEQKKRDLSVLPSNLTNVPPPRLSSPISPQDENHHSFTSSEPKQIDNRESETPMPPEANNNPQPPIPTVLRQIESRPENSEPDAQDPPAKRLNRKPRLISDSVELSSIPASEVLKEADELETSRRTSSQESIVAMELDELDTPRRSSKQGSTAAAEVNDCAVTPQVNRQSPRKRPSAAADSDANPSKKAKKRSNVEDLTNQVDTNTEPVRAPSLDKVGSGDMPESCSISTPLKSKLTDDVKPSVSTKKGSGSKAPISAIRLSTRKAAQLALQNVKSAAEDMNLHEQEKRRRRNSNAKEVGLEDVGYFGSSPGKSKQLSVRKRYAKDSDVKRAGSESDGNDNSIVIQTIKQTNSKRGRRSAENKKITKSHVKESQREEGEHSDEESSDGGGLPTSGMISALFKKEGKVTSGNNNVKEQDPSSDLESITLTSAKKPPKKRGKVKAEDQEDGPKQKTKTQSTAGGSKLYSTLVGLSKSKRVCITESGVRIDPKISSKLMKMGAKFIESTPSFDDGCTHLLTNKIARTEKFLSCIVLGCHVVTHRWAEECVKRNEFIDEEGYELKDMEGERVHEFQLSRSLQIARSRQILSGFEIFLTPFVANQHCKLLKKLILLAGGQVLSKVPSLEELQKTADQITNMYRQAGSQMDDDDDGNLRGNVRKMRLIVSCKEDAKYLRSNLVKKKKFMGNNMMPIFDSNLILQEIHYNFFLTWNILIKMLKNLLLLKKPYIPIRSIPNKPHPLNNKPHPKHRLIIPCAAIATGIYYYYYHQYLDDESLAVHPHRPFPIIGSKQLTGDTALIEVEVVLPEERTRCASTMSIESVYVKHPGLQIERPYTPLSPISLPHPSLAATHSRTLLLHLLVKKYPLGDLSSFIHHAPSLPLPLEIRGPVLTWSAPNHHIDELVFIAAGTGITPAIQLLRRIFHSPSQEQQQQQPGPREHLPKFNLIYLSRSLDSAYLLDEIQDFQSRFPELIHFKLLLDHPPHPPNSASKPVDKVGRLQLTDLQKWLGTSNPDIKKIILVCGPDSLICAVAGCKGPGLHSQGKIGGMLKSLGYSKDQVVKL